MAGGVPGVAHLEDDAELPPGQHHVVVDVLGGAAADGLVMLEQLIAGRHARQVQVPGGGHVVRLRPPREQRPAQVEQRVADRGHLPVDDGRQRGRRRVAEHHVRELVVAVHDPRLPLPRPAAAQPLRRLVETRQVPELVAGQERQPAVHLPVMEIVGAAEAGQAAGLPVHPGQQRGALDEAERQRRAVRSGCVVRGGPARAAGRRPAVDLLHQVERPAEDIGIRAAGRPARRAVRRCP